MAYEAKTDWLPDTEIREDDLNRWEQGIDDAHNELDSHKKDQTNPHRVTKKQVGLGNVDDVQQASKEDFDSHKNNINNPHRVNSTQINVITARDAAANYSEYPTGITIAETGTGKSIGYPWDFILIETEQLGANRTVQTIYDMSSSTVIRSMVRKYREADGGWGDWAKTETEAAAQEKADKAESNAKNASVPRTGGTMSGDLILDNDKKISHKSPNGEIRRTIHRGGDDNIYINTDSIGKTVIRGARVVNKDDKDFETIDGSQSKANQAESRAKAASVSKLGDTMSGPLNFDVTDPTPINIKRRGNSNNANVKLEHDGAVGHIGIDKNGNWKIDTGTDPNLDGSSTAEFIETTAGAQEKADTVKSYVQQYGLGVAARSGIDWDALSTSGFYSGSMNGPISSVVIGVHIQHGSAYAYQIAGRRDEFWSRTRESGTWSSWERMETTAESQSKANKAENNAIMAFQAEGLGSNGLQDLMNLNDASTTGWRSFGSTASNAPRSARGVVHSIFSGTDDGIQLAYLTGARTEFMRRKTAGVWSDWLQTAGNMEEGWRDLTPRGGAQIWTESAPPQVLRIGDHVFLRGALKGITNRKFLCLTLPGDCRPQKDHVFIQNTSTDGYKARLARWIINPDGNVYVDYNTDDVWDAEKWYPIDTHFTVTSS
ncbi:pyocin knob domain-containing protein [Terribacillus sp. 7520-G]|uniref:pyocin knob domain-containing protein n=1 Tax=Terribacillus TaxID=459532 RepID=UPI000BA710CD|nr:pyocin knob domain-containing protein [Terribacillus sp. 7520-G]